MGTKRKWKAKYTWLTIFLAIIVFVGIVFFRTTWVENYLAHKLIERTAAESDGFYQLSYDKLSISFLNGELKLKGVKLVPDSTIYNDWARKDSLPNTYMELSIDMIHFKGLNLTWRHDFKKLHFKSFQIKTPNIKIFQTNDLARPKKKHHASSKNIYQMISTYIAELSVNELNLDNASIVFTAINPQSPIVYALQNVSFDAYGFCMNQETYENGKLLFCDSFKFTTNEPQQLINNNDFRLNTNSISLNTLDSLVLISDIQLITNRKNPGFPENSIDATVQSVSIDGINFQRKDALNTLAIRSFNILSPQIATSHIAELSNETKEEKEQKKKQQNHAEEESVLTKPLTIYDIISPLFHRLTIDEIDISKARVNYKLHTEKGEDLFKVNELTFKAYDLIIDSVATSNNQYLFSQNFQFILQNVSGAMTSSNHHLDLAQLTYNSQSGNLTLIDLMLRPISTMHQQDYITASVKSVLLNGLDYSKGVDINSFIINNPQLIYTVAGPSKHKSVKTKKDRDKQEHIKRLFSPLLNHFSLKNFKLEKAEIMVVDERPVESISYQLKDFNAYATDLRLSQNKNNKKGYSFTYGKMGFSFNSFDNLLPGNEYRLYIKQGEYSTMTDLLDLKDILLSPLDTQFAKSKSNLRFSSPALTVAGLNYQEVKDVKEISLNQLRLISPEILLNEKSGDRYEVQLSDFAIDSLFWDKNRFYIGAIDFNNPRIDIFSIAQEKKKKPEKKHKEVGLPKLELPDSLYHKLSAIANEISLGRFSLSDALVAYTSQEKDTTIHLKLDTTSVALTNLYINNEARTFSWGQPYLSTCNLSYPLDHGLYNIAVKSVKLINDSLHIGGMSYTSPYSMMEFSYVDPRHKSWFNVTIDAINLSGINYTDLLEHNRVQLRSMDINYIMFQNFVNQKTKLPRHKWFPMIYSYLQKLPVGIDIPVINVLDFTVIYEELSRKGTTPGKLILQDMTGTITNVTNILPAKQPYMIANLAGKLMGKGDFDIEWQVPVDSLNDHFILTANVGEFHLPDLNELVTPIAPLEIKSGNLKKMTFRAEGSSISAKSDMLLQYDSLYAAFVDTKEHKVKEHRFVSAIANRIIRHNNDNEHAITEIKRDAYHPTFNYIWQIMEPALVESVGIPEKEQEKAVKAISFIDKVLHFFQPKKKKMQLKYPDLILPEEEKKE